MIVSLPPLGAGTTRLILLRHGEPDAGVRGRCYGRLDPGLSAAGRACMRKTWLVLQGEPIAAVYSSPSRRAVESADARPAGDPEVIVDPDLREIAFGEFEGLTYNEIAARFPREYANWMSAPTTVTFPGGEAFAAMAARVSRALERIRRCHRATTVAIVSHGGVNRLALAAALDLEPSRIFRLAQGYGCVNVIDYVGDAPLVHLMNATLAAC
jgi:broad specificity phosphatase PhoE